MYVAAFVHCQHKANSLIEKVVQPHILCSKMVQPFTKIIKEYEMDIVSPSKHLVRCLSSMKEKVFETKNEMEESERSTHHELEHFIGNPSREIM